MPNIYARPISPPAFKPQVIRLEILNEMRKVGREVLEDYARTVETWKDKPKFETQLSLTNANGPVLFAGLKDDGSEGAKHFVMVNEGTPPHEIFAGAYTGQSEKKALSFPGTFTAKTVPGVLQSGSGGEGGAQVATPYVQHPGIKARKFDEAIQFKWTSQFSVRMQEALYRGAQKTGHA